MTGSWKLEMGVSGFNIVHSSQDFQYNIGIGDHGSVEPSVSFDHSVDRSFDVSGRVKTTELSLAGDGATVVYPKGLSEPPRGVVCGEEVSLSDETVMIISRVNGVEVVFWIAEGTGTVSVGSDETQVMMDSSEWISFGVQDLAEQTPTITTTREVSNIARTVSHVATAEQLTSPARFSPAARQPVPSVEFGDSFDGDETVDNVDSAVRIEVPPSLEDIYSVSTLAYYLGAPVNISDCAAPKLHVGETIFALRAVDVEADHIIGKETAAEGANVLFRHLLFIDMLTYHHRHGLPLPREVRAFEQDLKQVTAGQDYAPAERYESHVERLAACLEADISLATCVSRWYYSADVKPTPDSVTALPRLMGGLAEVRSHGRRQSSDDIVAGGQAQKFFERNHDEELLMRGGADTQTGAQSSGPGSAVDEPRTGPGPTATMGSGDVVSLSPGPYRQQIAVGDSYPIWSVKPVQNACGELIDNRQTPSQSDQPRTAVVCNDPQLVDAINEMYDRSELDAPLTLNMMTSMAELRQLLESNYEFFHFIGHVDEDGLFCGDGSLDVSTVGVDIDVFFLSGCESYDQGRKLVQNGSAGGLVTTAPIVNRDAVKLGRDMVTLLSRGFSVGGIIGMARHELNVPPRYMGIGDWRARVIDADSPQEVIRISRSDKGDDQVSVTAAAFDNGNTQPGRVVESELLRHLGVQHPRWVAPGYHPSPVSVPVDNILSISGLHDTMIVVRGELYEEPPPEELLRSVAQPTGNYR